MGLIYTKWRAKNSYQGLFKCSKLQRLFQYSKMLTFKEHKSSFRLITVQFDSFSSPFSPCCLLYRVPSQALGEMLQLAFGLQLIPCLVHNSEPETALLSYTFSKMSSALKLHWKLFKTNKGHFHQIQRQRTIGATPLLILLKCWRQIENEKLS